MKLKQLITAFTFLACLVSENVLGGTFVYKEAREICKSGVVPPNFREFLSEFLLRTDFEYSGTSTLGDCLIGLYRKSENINEPFVSLSSEVLADPVRFLGRISSQDYLVVRQYQEAFAVYEAFYPTVNLQYLRPDHIPPSPEKMRPQREVTSEELIKFYRYMLVYMGLNKSGSSPKDVSELIQKDFRKHKESYVEQYRVLMTQYAIGLKSALNNLAQLRQQIAVRAGDSDAKNYGKARSGFYYTPGLKYRPYLNQIEQWVGDSTDYICYSPDYCDAIRGRINAKTVVENTKDGQVKLTQLWVAKKHLPKVEFEWLFGYQDDFRPGGSNFCMVHTSIEQSHKNINDLQDAFAEIQKKNDWNREDLFREVGRIHWWLAHSPLWVRGSAAVYEILTEALLQSKGYYVRYIGPQFIDLDAITTPNVNVFSQKYMGYFEVVGP